MLATILHSTLSLILWWTIPALVLWALSIVYRKVKDEYGPWSAAPFAAIILGVSWYAQYHIGWKILLITLVFYIIYCWFQFARVRYESSQGWQKYLWGAVYAMAFVVGGPLDIVYQHTLAIWPIFWDHAEEMTLTERLGRYLTQGKYYHTWRWWIAWALCKALDPWQQGGHCKHAVVVPN